jgi:16S rRNA processing protein RimM
VRSTETPRTALLCLGRISGAHGLKGEVRIESYTGAPEDIAAYGPLSDEAGARRFEISSLRVVKGGTIVARLSGVPDRAAAESLRGVRLYVERGNLPEPGEDEWYYTDLIALKALSPEGRLLGEVASIQNFGAGDLLEIRLAANKKTIFIPFTSACVPHIDIKLGSLTLNAPQQLPEDEQSGA